MPAPTWAPTVAQVAEIVPQRTGDATGRASGAFSASTTPTDTQVAGEITQAVWEVQAVVGDNPDSDLAAMATRAVALLTASYVELSFYPDANLTAQGPAAQLYARYKDLLALIGAASDVGVDPGSGGEEATGTPEGPAYNFPAAVETGQGTTTWEQM